jgi:heat shock protein HslJ
MKTTVISLCLVSIVAVFAGCSASSSKLSTTKWTVESLNGTKLTSAANKITFNVDSEVGKVSGKAPCNSYSSSYDEYNEQFRLNAVISTKMACDQLSLETEYFTALGRVTRYKLTGSRLSLYAGDVLIIDLVKVP